MSALYEDTVTEVGLTKEVTHDPLLVWLTGRGPENNLGHRPETFWERLDQFRQDVNRANWEVEEMTKIHPKFTANYQRQLRIAEKNLLEALTARYPFLNRIPGLKPKTP